jgi:hypothetical protein
MKQNLFPVLLVARQLRSSLLRYMASNKFRPAAKLTSEQFKSLMATAN